jgi:chromosome segregation protein
LLAAGDGSGDVPIADSLTVADGMEQALTACLAEELSSPAGSGEVSYWRSAAAPHDLVPPEGTRPLADSVIGAPELASTLAGIGVVDSSSEAQFLQDSLRPGQSVTTPQGGLWRWDGFVRRAGAQDSGAERIRQRQRLETLEAELAEAAIEQNRLAGLASTADEALAEARAAQTGARADAAESTSALATARRAEESTKLRLSAAEERADELRTTAVTLGDDLVSAEAEAAALGDDAALQKSEAEARQAADAVRTRVAEAMQAESRFAEAVRVSSERLASAATETEAWQKRLAGAENRVGEMKTRLAEGEAEIERLSAMPDALAKQRDALADTLQAAETVRQQAADDLRRAETELATAETAQREADATLAASREQLVRAEGARDFATETRRVIQEQISDKLDCTPDGLADIADIEDAAGLPEITVLEERVHRLIRERDTIGPVNLRAETEMEEVAARIESIEAEQEDLVAAIDKLRSAISRLNRQGREQLLNSFAAVNNHFKDLFKVLFGGGTAELQLTESADPLEAGLEILAQPPGKRLQSLSLLSGGEQALTALAIIFAVFLTNPAPICVLDEVDAPLDDTNVARFCDLLRDIAGKTDTRFMVITHHRMTMARMDRLFGVTMEQRGISKLVSVDLQTAERIRDAAVA